MAKQKPMSAAELIARLEKDPEFQEKMRIKEENRVAIEIKNRFEETSLVKELQDAGVIVEVNSIPSKEYVGLPRSISDLVNTRRRYPTAIPVLLKHLQIEYSQDIKESIVRALMTPDSRGIAFGPLVKLFKDTTDSESQLKWAIGAAIAETAEEADIDEIIELTNDQKHGQGRAELPLALINMQNQKAIPILEIWSTDPIVGNNAKKALHILGRKRSPEL